MPKSHLKKATINTSKKKNKVSTKKEIKMLSRKRGPGPYHRFLKSQKTQSMPHQWVRGAKTVHLATKNRADQELAQLSFLWVPKNQLKTQGRAPTSLLVHKSLRQKTFSWSSQEPLKIS